MYYTKRIIDEIAPILKNRETSFLSPKGSAPIRCIKVNHSDYLQKNFDVWKVEDKQYNLYYSLAIVQNMPTFSFAPNIRKEQYVEFNHNFDTKYWNGDYDLGIDFDGKENNQFNNCKKDVSKIKKIFDDYGIPYQLKYSGNQGFHINIDDKYLPEVLAKVEWCSLFASELVDVFNLSALDLSIYDSRRIWKVPYSRVIESGHIALPLTDKQFDTFIFDYVKPGIVMCKLQNTSYRGLLTRLGTQKNVKKFIKDFLLPVYESLQWHYGMREMTPEEMNRLINYLLVDIDKSWYELNKKLIIQTKNSDSIKMKDNIISQALDYTNMGWLK